MTLAFPTMNMTPVRLTHSSFRFLEYTEIGWLASRINQQVRLGCPMNEQEAFFLGKAEASLRRSISGDAQGIALRPRLIPMIVMDSVSMPNPVGEA